MQTFKEFIENLVYRLDDQYIKNFNTNLKTYHRNTDWTQSGTFGPKDIIPKNWKKEIGLYAALLKHIAPYATPRGTPFITYKKNVVFNKTDKSKIINHKPTLSAFDSSFFTKLSSDEYFSPNPPKPVSQEIIENPLQFIKQYYKVSFVPNIGEFIKILKSKNIQYNGENVSNFNKI